MCQPYLLLELLMDCIHRIFDGNTLQVPCSDFEAKWEMQINLLERRVGEELFEYCRIFYRVRRRVKSPIYSDQHTPAVTRPLMMTANIKQSQSRTYQFNF